MGAEFRQGIPVSSFRRSLTVILILQTSASLLTLLAGSCILVHVTPRSQCLLFIHDDGNSLSYGSYYYCELLGSGHILSFLLMLVTAILNFKQIRKLITASGVPALKGLKYLKVKQKTTMLQWLNCSVMLILSVILTVGFRASCDIFRIFVEDKIDKKLNIDLTKLRGETVDERFVDDPFFWRYTKKVTNSFGADMFSTVTSCRVMMTDPALVTMLHDNHAQKFAGYYGYWYDEDVYPLDPSSEAMKTNTLMEISLAASWLASLVWLGLGVYIMIVSKRTEDYNRRFNLDKSLLTSSASLSRPGTPDSVSPGKRKSLLARSQASSLRDIDSLALESLIMASDLELGKRKLQKPQVVKSNPLTFVFNYQNTQVTEVL